MESSFLLFHHTSSLTHDSHRALPAVSPGRLISKPLLSSVCNLPLLALAASVGSKEMAAMPAASDQWNLKPEVGCDPFGFVTNSDF